MTGDVCPILLKPLTALMWFSFKASHIDTRSPACWLCLASAATHVVCIIQGDAEWITCPWSSSCRVNCDWSLWKTAEMPCFLIFILISYLGLGSPPLSFMFLFWWMLCQCAGLWWKGQTMFNQDDMKQQWEQWRCEVASGVYEWLLFGSGLIVMCFGRQQRSLRPAFSHLWWN